MSTQKLIEQVPFTASLLMSPSLALTINGAMSYSDSLGDIVHSVRTYKGKVFFLVSLFVDHRLASMCLTITVQRRCSSGDPVHVGRSNTGLC